MCRNKAVVCFSCPACFIGVIRHFLPRPAFIQTPIHVSWCTAVPGPAVVCVFVCALAAACGQSVVAAVGGTARQADNRVWRDLTSTTTIFTRPKREARLVATHTQAVKQLARKQIGLVLYIFNTEMVSTQTSAGVRLLLLWSSFFC